MKMNDFNQYSNISKIFLSFLFRFVLFCFVLLFVQDIDKNFTSLWQSLVLFNVLHPFIISLRNYFSFPLISTTSFRYYCLQLRFLNKHACSWVQPQTVHSQHGELTSRISTLFFQSP